MKDKETRIIEQLLEHAEWAHANEWETPLTLGDNIEEAADLIKQLATANGSLIAAGEKKHKENQALRRELEEAKRERDAAIEDIKICVIMGLCYMCRKFHLLNPPAKEGYCKEIGPQPDFEGALGCSMFEWRGAGEREYGE